MDKPKDVFHTVDNGTFERDGKEFSYIVEQNKNNNPSNPKNIRVRVVKVQPKVTRIRTRYEPHVEIDGTADAFMPSIWGYDIKHLKKRLILIPVMLGLVGVAYSMPLWTAWINRATLSISLPEWVGQGIAYTFLIFAVGFLLLFFMAPLVFSWIRTLKMYRFLKKNGKPYAEREAIFDELSQ